MGGSPPAEINNVWPMDLVPDRLFDGRAFWILTVIDCHTREALSTASGTIVRTYQIAGEFERVIRLRGKRQSLRVDNGPEFAGQILDQWARLKRGTLDVSRHHYAAAVEKAALSTRLSSDLRCLSGCCPRCRVGIPGRLPAHLGPGTACEVPRQYGIHARLAAD